MVSWNTHQVRLPLFFQTNTFDEGPVEKVRQRRSRAFVELRAHRLGALRAVRPHVLRVRSGRQSPCGLARGKMASWRPWVWAGDIAGLFEQALGW